MISALLFVRKHLHYLMIAAILAGISNIWFFGGFDIPKTVLVTIVVTLVIYPVMINTRFEDLFSHFKEPRPVFCSLALNFVISPLTAFFLAKTFLADHPELFAALVLISLVPTSAMSAAWTAFSGARMATVLYLVPLNIIFAAIIGLPVLLPYLVGDLVVIKTLTILKNLLLVFLLPLVVGDISRRVIVKLKGESFFQKKIKPNAGSVSAAGLLILIFLVMSLKRNAVLLQDFSLVLTVVVPVLLYYLVIYGVSIPWALLLIRRKLLPGDRAVVLIYTSAARHINISIAIVLASFPLEQASAMLLLLIIAYLVQVPTLAFFSQKYGRKMVSGRMSP